MAVADEEHPSESARSLTVRMAVGVCAFSLAAIMLLSLARNIAVYRYWPMFLAAGGLFGVAATLVTRGAGRRPLRRPLAALGYASLCLIAVSLLVPADTDRYIGPLPADKFVKITWLVIPLWLFLSSRAGRRSSA